MKNGPARSWSLRKTNGAEDWRSSRTTEAGLYDHQIVKDHITELNGLLDSVAHLERTRDESIPIEVLNRMEDHLKPFMSRHHSNLDDALLHSKSDPCGYEGIPNCAQPHH